MKKERILTPPTPSAGDLTSGLDTLFNAAMVLKIGFLAVIIAVGWTMRAISRRS